MSVIEKLQNAFDTKDAELVEASLYEEPINDPRYIQLLIDLLPLDWHISHENIVLILQQLRPEGAVGNLAKVATTQFKYLAYNDSLALARKCTWALSAIGNKEALVALNNLASCGVSEIENYAKKRLVT